MNFQKQHIHNYVGNLDEPGFTGMTLKNVKKILQIISKI